MYTGDCMTLSGTAYDPDGEPIVLWSWIVESAPPGSLWNLWPASPSTATFCAHTPGQYMVSLLVEDPSGGSVPDVLTITIADNLPPVAIATADKIEGPAPLTVQFDGSQSYDPEGKPLVRYAWDFGDGTAGFFEPVPPPHTYLVPGSQNVVTLTVTDERRLLTTETLIITVNPPANTLPVASPTASPDSGDAPLTVQFTANATDADNDPLTYLWDFGDGNISSEANPSYLYTLAGTYLVSLTVSDGKDPVGYSLTIVVNPDIGFYVTSATVKWQKAPLGDVALEGFLSYAGAATPAPGDTVALWLDGVQLFSQSFSAFEYDARNGDYVFNAKAFLVKINFVANTIAVATPSKTNLFGLDAANGVQVELHIGSAAAVETIPMIMTRKNTLGYQRP